MKLPFIIIGAVVVAIVAVGAGFFGGMTYAQTQAQTQVNDFVQQRARQNAQDGATQNVETDPCGFPIRNQQNAQGNNQNRQGNNQNRQGGNGQRGGIFGGLDPEQLGNCVARGQIKAVNGDTVEISTADKVIVVKVNNDTLISKTDKGALSDLQPGDRVTVFSKETGDSPTASTIQLQRPIVLPQQ